ncbi:MAG: efflux transporter periplasmic adaptor subunit, partial [Betaproteobacteria bacterium]
MLNQKYLGLLLVTIALASCTEQTETPKAPSSPVYQRGGLHYPEQHPQLKLLALSPVRQAQVEKIELPARLVWNEEKTQRVYSAFSG